MKKAEKRKRRDRLADELLADKVKENGGAEKMPERPVVDVTQHIISYDGDPVLMPAKRQCETCKQAIDGCTGEPITLRIVLIGALKTTDPANPLTPLQHSVRFSLLQSICSEERIRFTPEERTLLRELIPLCWSGPELVHPATELIPKPI